MTFARTHWIPANDDGQPISPPTAWRWYKRGLRPDPNGPRIKLRVVMRGSAPYTRKSWVDAFLAALTAARVGTPESSDDDEADDRGRNAATEQQLSAAGLL